MAQIIIKEYGTKIFQRDFNRTEENIIALIKDMAAKGIISISTFKKIFSETINDTKDIYFDSMIECSEKLCDTVIK
jgi:hypothetical protein